MSPVRLIRINGKIINLLIGFLKLKGGFFFYKKAFSILNYKKE